jgi:hypothetical protein
MSLELTDRSFQLADRKLEFGTNSRPSNKVKL